MRLNETVPRQPGTPAETPCAVPETRSGAGRVRGAAFAAAALLASGAVLLQGGDAPRRGPASSPAGADDLPAPELRPGTALEAQEVELLQIDDADGDGLTDAQEAVLETLAHSDDSDGDGFSDAEEIARHSDPLLATSVPATTLSAAGLTARGEGGQLRVVLCVHEPAQQQGDALIRVGVSAGGQVVPLPLDRLALSGDVTTVDGSGGSSVTCIDVGVDPAFVHAHGFVSFFVASGSEANQLLESAGKIDIFSDGQNLFLQMAPSAVLAQQQTGQGGVTIRRPIPVVIGPPPESNWIAGAVCFQRSEVIGVNGPRLLHQIVEADCIGGWDTFCAGDCSAAIGDTYETVDPWSLIGG